jgi:soluble lytic murein transglycosylase-like protein
VAEPLSELELRYARSRRRAERLRREPRKRSLLASRAAWAAAVAAVLLLGVAAESAREVSRSGSAPEAGAAGVGSGCPLPAPYRRAFADAAASTHLPLSLLAAVAYEESRLDPAARSHAGARGLLQVMPGTAKALQLSRTQPEANILAGARYLKQLVARFGNLELALAAYNAGPTAVEKAGAAPSLAVLRYVKNVEARAATLWTSC